MHCSYMFKYTQVTWPQAQALETWFSAWLVKTFASRKTSYQRVTRASRGINTTTVCVTVRSIFSTNIVKKIAKGRNPKKQLLDKYTLTKTHFLHQKWFVLWRYKWFFTNRKKLLQDLLTFKITTHKKTKSNAKDAGRLNKAIFTDTFLMCETKLGAQWEKPTRKYAQNDQHCFQHTSGTLSTGGMISNQRNVCYGAWTNASPCYKAKNTYGEYLEFLLCNLTNRGVQIKELRWEPRVVANVLG